MADELEGVSGQSGVSGQDRADVLALSDTAKKVQATRQAAMEANTARNLKAALDTQHQGKMQSLNDQVADHIMKSTEPDPDTQPQLYMDRLSERIVDMEKQAKAVQKSGTGNQGAYLTYMKVAEILKQRLHALQSKAVGAPIQLMQKTVQPPTEQPMLPRLPMMQKTVQPPTEQPMLPRQPIGLRMNNQLEAPQ
jgi:hypothetical protein